MKKVIQKHSECIGCGTCAVLCPDFWEMRDDMKAHPKVGKKNPETGDYEFEIEEKDLVCNQDAIDACPVQIIKITNE